MKTDLVTCLRSPVFSETDRRFAQFLVREDGGKSEFIGIVAALTSYQLRNGQVFLDLARPPVWEDPAEAPLQEWLTLGVWRDDLCASAVVGGPGEEKPLLLTSSGKIYLHRYWVYESLLAEKLRERARALDIDRVNRLEARLEELFPGAPEQKAAAKNALLRPFSLISGGPGTGKTTTVLKILAVMLEQNPDLVIRLTAPTGKAAARLQESIRVGVGKLDCDDQVRVRIGEQQASTIHRLLGAVAGSVHFRHHGENPLAADLVILDEASMVDLPLMVKFFLALPATCRVIMLGDADQLASVEAGSVLRGIVEAASLAADDKSASPLAGVATLLQTNFRFGNDSAIYRVCAAVRAGDDAAALEILNDEATAELRRRDLPNFRELKERLRPVVLEKWDAFLAQTDAGEALNAFGRFQVLTAVRKGPFGKENVNLCIEEILREEGLIPIGRRDYSGRPIMVTENDYAVRLFNGDVGVLLEDEEERLMAFFRTEDGAIRKVSPLRLPHVESAFAMTIHKSQGSEFDEVLTILPDRDSPVVSRELIYTAISRAKRKVEVWAGEEILRLAIRREVARASGLIEMLATDDFLRRQEPGVETERGAASHT